MSLPCEHQPARADRSTFMRENPSAAIAGPIITASRGSSRRGSLRPVYDTASESVREIGSPYQADQPFRTSLIALRRTGPLTTLACALPGLVSMAAAAAMAFLP